MSTQNPIGGHSSPASSLKALGLAIEGLLWNVNDTEIDEEDLNAIWLLHSETLQAYKAYEKEMEEVLRQHQGMVEGKPSNDESDESKEDEQEEETTTGATISPEELSQHFTDALQNADRDEAGTVSGYDVFAEMMRKIPPPKEHVITPTEETETHQTSDERGKLFSHRLSSLIPLEDARRGKDAWLIDNLNPVLSRALGLAEIIACAPSHIGNGVGPETIERTSWALQLEIGDAKALLDTWWEAKHESADQEAA